MIERTVSRPGSAARFIAAFAAVFAVLVGLNLAVNALQFGRSTDISAEFCGNIGHRVALGRSIADPKLVLIGGSGVRRGINAGMMAADLDIPVLNFGLQASLGPELILDSARQALRPGDVALLVLEYNQYGYDRYAPFALEVVYDCMPEVFRQASLARQAEILLAVPLDRAVRAFRFADAGADAAPAPGVLPGLTGSVGVGDVALTEERFPPLSRRDRQRVELYRPTDIGVEPASMGVAAIAEFVRWAQQNGVAVLASWPNTIDFPAYRSEPGFEEIRSLYQGLGVPVVGDPALGLYPVEDFYDTQYHLDRPAIPMRTRALTAALRSRPELAPLIERGRLTAEGPGESRD